MGMLGDHPNVLSIHDLGDEGGQPYLVLPLMPGGDVASLLEEAEDHRLRLALLRRGDKMVRSGSIGRAEDILYLPPEKVETRVSARGFVGACRGA